MVDGINIDNAFVLGPATDSPLPAGGQAGVFLSLEAQSSDQLTSVTAPGAASSVQLASGPVTLNPDNLVDLSGPAPQVVLNGLTNSLSGGETIQLVLHFATAGAVTLMVPVEPAAYEFATFSPPAAFTPLASGSASPGAKHKKKANAGASASATASASPSASVSPSATP
jgi:copper(I)-binding protein